MLALVGVESPLLLLLVALVLLSIQRGLLHRWALEIRELGLRYIKCRIKLEGLVQDLLIRHLLQSLIVRLVREEHLGAEGLEGLVDLKAGLDNLMRAVLEHTGLHRGPGLRLDLLSIILLL